VNKRIQELVKQAQKVVGYTDGGYTEIKALDQEKFAELIVKECIGVCEEYHGTAGDQAAQYIGQGIKEHFGVEE